MSRVSTAAARTPAAGRRRDYRGLTFGVLTVAVVAVGYVFSALPGAGVRAVAEPRALAAPKGFEGLVEATREVGPGWGAPLPLEFVLDPSDPLEEQVRAILEAAHARIEAREYDEAIEKLNEARPLVAKYAESYLLLGRALEGRRDYETARDFYGAALDRDPFLTEAWWGVATTSDALADLEGALGAMRAYLHTEPDKDPGRLRIAQARSALWEWEARLGRGPWGPTRGIPPGFTEDELKRDGRGVAMKVPVPGTERPDGTLQGEMKHAEKFELFRRP